MPPLTGAGGGIFGIRSVLEEAKRNIAKATSNLQAELAAEMNGLARDIEANGRLVVQKVREERHDVRAHFDDLLGNAHAGQTDDVEGKPQAGEDDPGKAPPPPETETVTTEQVGTLPPNVLGGTSS